jgi:flagellar biogenesis protein FliO
MIKYLFSILLVFTPALFSEETIPYPYQEQLDQANAETSPFIGQFLYMLLILGLMVSLLLAGTWVIKRLMHGKMVVKDQDSLIQLMDRRQLTHRTTIYIVAVNNREIALAESTNGVTYLGESPTTTPKRFENLLRKE